MAIESLGVDIAKNVSQLHGVSRNGHVVLRRRVIRDELIAAMARIDRCTVVLEACTGAVYWARKFEALGRLLRNCGLTLWKTVCAVVVFPVGAMAAV